MSDSFNISKEFLEKHYEVKILIMMPNQGELIATTMTAFGNNGCLRINEKNKFIYKMTMRHEGNKTLVENRHYKNHVLHKADGPAFEVIGPNNESLQKEFYFNGVKYNTLEEILSMSADTTKKILDDGLHYEKTITNFDTKQLVIETRLIDSDELDSYNDQPSLVVYFIDKNTSNKTWHKNGKIHRDNDLPASNDHCTYYWYKNGEQVRENGPVMVQIGREELYKNIKGNSYYETKYNMKVSFTCIHREHEGDIVRIRIDGSNSDGNQIEYLEDLDGNLSDTTDPYNRYGFSQDPAVTVYTGGGDENGTYGYYIRYKNNKKHCSDGPAKSKFYLNYGYNADLIPGEDTEYWYEGVQYSSLEEIQNLNKK